MANEPKKRGRPSIPVEERKNRNLTFRARGDLRDRLAKRAAENDRSISEEIELQLIRALDREEYQSEVLGPRLREVVTLMPAAVAMVQRHTGKTIDGDRWTAAIAAMFLMRMLAWSLRPADGKRLLQKELTAAEPTALQLYEILVGAVREVDEEETGHVAPMSRGPADTA